MMIKFDIQRFNGSTAEFGLLSRADKNFIDSIPDLYATKDALRIMQNIINALIDRVSVLEENDTQITNEDIQLIMQGNYIPIADPEPIEESEIESIVNGNYVPVEDSEGLTEDDLNEILLSITIH